VDAVPAFDCHFEILNILNIQPAQLKCSALNFINLRTFRQIGRFNYQYFPLSGLRLACVDIQGRLAHVLWYFGIHGGQGHGR